MHEEIQIIRNRTKQPLDVWVEPWAFQHVLKLGEVLKIVAVSAVKGHFEIEKTENRIAVYGWNGCTVKIYVNDLLEFNMDIALPMLDGLTQKEFVKALFGGSGGPICLDPPPAKGWRRLWIFFGFKKKP